MNIESYKMKWKIDVQRTNSSNNRRHVHNFNMRATMKLSLVFKNPRNYKDHWRKLQMNIESYKMKWKIDVQRTNRSNNRRHIHNFNMRATKKKPVRSKNPRNYVGLWSKVQINI